jgi:hypothetical protein
MLLLGDGGRTVPAKGSTSQTRSIDSAIGIQVPLFQERAKRGPVDSDQLAAIFGSLRKKRRMAEELGISNHPRIATAMSTHGTSDTTVNGLCSVVMYSDDFESKYSNQKKVQAANRQAKARLDKLVSRKGGVPRLCSGNPLVTVSTLPA